MLRHLMSTILASLFVASQYTRLKCYLSHNESFGLLSQQLDCETDSIDNDSVLQSECEKCYCPWHSQGCNPLFLFDSYNRANDDGFVDFAYLFASHDGFWCSMTCSDIAEETSQKISWISVQWCNSESFQLLCSSESCNRINTCDWFSFETDKIGSQYLQMILRKIIWEQICWLTVTKALWQTTLHNALKFHS